ncbi:MAG: glycosyltransferase family 2 protein, partial [Methylococcales bacterium]
MKLSLILATRNRAAVLARFLKHLATIPGPRDWEILIADNGSSDHTADILAEWTSRLPLKSVHVPVPGKSRALNEALA